MTAIGIIGAVLLGLIVLALVPVQMKAEFTGGLFTLTGRAGPVPVRLFPRREAPGRKPGKSLRRPSLPVLRLLAECGCRTLARMIRRVRIETLRLRYLAAGPDPCRTAMAYAWAGLAMEGIARMVPGSDLRAEADFQNNRPALEGTLALRMRLGEAVYAAVCFGIGFLRGYFRYQREKE